MRTNDKPAHLTPAGTGNNAWRWGCPGYKQFRIHTQLPYRLLISQKSLTHKWTNRLPKGGRKMSVGLVMSREMRLFSWSSLCAHGWLCRTLPCPISLMEAWDQQAWSRRLTFCTHAFIRGRLLFVFWWHYVKEYPLRSRLEVLHQPQPIRLAFTSCSSNRIFNQLIILVVVPNAGYSFCFSREMTDDFASRPESPNSALTFPDRYGSSIIITGDHYTIHDYANPEPPREGFDSFK